VTSSSETTCGWARASSSTRVTIGDGSVVSAGLVVTKSLPPGSVAVGNAARIVRRRRDYAEAVAKPEPEGDTDPVTTPA
jgi:serine acetyltransferase